MPIDAYCNFSLLGTFQSMNRAKAAIYRAAGGIRPELGNVALARVAWWLPAARTIRPAPARPGVLVFIAERRRYPQPRRAFRPLFA